jgi:hypothetical protein
MTSGRVASAVLLGAAAVAGVFLWRSASLLRELWRPGVETRDLVRVALVVAVLLAAEAALLASLRLAPPRRASAALAAVSTLAVLYACEVALALAGPRPGAKLQEKLARLAEMRGRGANPSPGIEPVRFVWAHEPGSPSWLLIDGEPTLPLGGLSRRATLDCKEAGDWLVFDADEHGFHNPRGRWRPPLDLAFLGDSFVHGSCVPSESNMVAAVRRARPSTLNLGTPGGGPLIMLAQLREYLPALRPRTVVWCHFSGNDLLDLRRESEHPLLVRYLDPGFTQSLAAKQDAIDRGLEDYAERTMLPALERRSRQMVQPTHLLALRGLRTATGFALAAPYRLSPTPEEYASFARVLGEARRTVEAWGGRLVFAYLPAWEDAPRQLGEAEYHRVREQVGARTLELVHSMGIPVIDISRAFAAHSDPLSLYACPGCHYGPEGYALAGREILAGLQREGR